MTACPGFQSSTSRSDQSIRLLMRTLAQHRRLERLVVAQNKASGRLSALPSSSERMRTLRESTLVRLSSILEAHFFGELSSRLSLQIPEPRTTLIESLFTDFEIRATSNWREVSNHFKDHVSKDVKIMSAPQWNAVYAVTEARNAVVHGLGYFTSNQTRRGIPDKVIGDLRKLDFDVTPAGRIIAGPKAMDSSALSIRDYISWLDDQLLTIP